MTRTRSATVRALLGTLTIAASAAIVTVASAATAAKPLDGKQVGVIICTNQNPFCAAWSNTLKSSLESQGASVTVLTSVFDPSTDAQNFNRLIAQKPDLIVSVPASATAIIPSLIRAKQAGIKVLGAIGRLTPAGAKLVTAQVLTDDPALGKFAAMNVVEGMQKAGHKTGNVIAVTGTATQLNTVDRMAAFKAYLKKYPQYKLVEIVDVNWDQAKSAQVTQQLLSKWASKGGIQGAYGMADNMAVGIIQGAKQAGVPIGVAKKGLIVTGSNCLAVGISAIKSGLEYGTATQAPAVEAQAAAKAAATILKGGTVPAKSYVTEYRITKKNVNKFVKQCSF